MIKKKIVAILLLSVVLIWTAIPSYAKTDVSSALKKQISTLQSQVKDLQSRLNANVSENKKLKSEIAALKKEKSQLNKQNDSLKITNYNFQAKISQLSAEKNAAIAAANDLKEVKPILATGSVYLNGVRMHDVTKFLYVDDKDFVEIETIIPLLSKENYTFNREKDRLDLGTPSQ